MKNNTFLLLFMMMLVALFGCLSTTAVAQSQPQPFDPKRVTLIPQLCPKVEILAQNPTTKIWYAPGGWRALNPSFFREIDLFVGAQWVGVSVGNVICSYAKLDKPEFPIHLQRDTVVASPAGGVWTQDKGGYKNCSSNDVTLCPFSVITRTKSKGVEDIYEDIDFYKTQPGT